LDLIIEKHLPFKNSFLILFVFYLHIFLLLARKRNFLDLIIEKHVPFKKTTTPCRSLLFIP